MGGSSDLGPFSAVNSSVQQSLKSPISCLIAALPFWCWILGGECREEEWISLPFTSHFRSKEVLLPYLRMTSHQLSLAHLWVLQRVLQSLPLTQFPVVGQPLPNATTWKWKTHPVLYHIPGLLLSFHLRSCAYIKILTLYHEFHQHHIAFHTCVSCVRHFLP